MQQPFENIKVLDFGRYIAAPACGYLLASSGAEVIRCEHPNGGEDRWIWPLDPQAEHEAVDTGAMYINLNRNKKSLAYRPTTELGRLLTKDLVATADVVIANLPDQALEKLGLDYESLKAINPKIILASNTCFGHTGPLATALGFDGLAQAMSGVQYMSGTEQLPTKCAAPWVDFLTAALTAFAISTAIRQRELTGLGQHLRTSLLQSAIFANSTALTEQATLNTNRMPTANASQTAGPADTVQVKDGQVVVQVLGQKQFERYCKMTDSPQLLADSAFTTDRSRGENREKLSEHLAQWAGDKTAEQVVTACHANSLPAAKVLDTQTALEHQQAQDKLTNTQYAHLDQVIASRFPILATGFEPNNDSAPTLGKDNLQVLTEIGYDKQKIEQLLMQNVIKS